MGDKQEFNIVTDNGFALKRCQAIIWINNEPVHLLIHASPGLNELKKEL